MRYTVTVVSTLGLKILDTPRPESRGAHKRRDVPIGTVLNATDIILPEGVPYAILVPQDPQKPEYCRISEAGGLSISPVTGDVFQVDGILTYAKVEKVGSNLTQDDLVDAIKDLAAAIRGVK